MKVILEEFGHRIKYCCVPMRLLSNYLIIDEAGSKFTLKVPSTFKGLIGVVITDSIKFEWSDIGEVKFCPFCGEKIDFITCES